MTAYKRLCFILLVVFLTVVAVMNVVLMRQENTMEGYYRVEVKTLADEIEDTGSYDLSDYPHLTGLYYDEGDKLYKSNNPYVIVRINGRLCRVEYCREKSSYKYVNYFFAAVFVITAAGLFYIGRSVLRPFSRLNNVPAELAKGNLAVPIPEERSRYFGKFTWGINMLRETIESSRKNELAVQREKKLLLLSLSHDIKTPLQAIKLNAKALARGLYKDESKQHEAAESINARADEIESYLSSIIQAASEDFMSFEVSMGEEYLSVIVGRVCQRYSEQLSLTGTELSVGKYSDSLLSCDPDRLAECLQNLFENAIKYGDGRKISLEFEVVDGCELITVCNTGCTIAPSELTQIFESFHRGSNSDKAQGSGLGLYICRKLMNLMDGEVFADIRDGCFCITLVVKLA